MGLSANRENNIKKSNAAVVNIPPNTLSLLIVRGVSTNPPDWNRAHHTFNEMPPEAIAGFRLRFSSQINVA
jgi:hypothetical protein